MRFLVAALLALSLVSSASADEIKKAQGLCAGLAMLTDFSKPCDVNGWGPSVDIWVDMTGAQAAEFCRGVVTLAAQTGLVFPRDWELRIYSPFSGENTIAYCTITPQ